MKAIAKDSYKIDNKIYEQGKEYNLPDDFYKKNEKYFEKSEGIKNGK